MLEINLSKDELTSKVNNRPFRISINNYKEINGTIDMNCITNVMRGSYIEKTNQAVDFGIGSVLDALDINTNIIVFDSINIKRELDTIEKYSRDAIEKALGISQSNDDKILIGKVFEQIQLFIKAVRLIKDKNNINNMLPVPVNSIAFIVKVNTEEDIVLEHEAKFIKAIEAPNGNTFNIYELVLR